MTNWKPFRVVTVILSGALVLVACSDDDGTDDGGTESGSNSEDGGSDSDDSSDGGDTSGDSGSTGDGTGTGGTGSASTTGESGDTTGTEPECNADLYGAPDPVAVAGGTATPIDIKSVDVKYTFDVDLQQATGDATVRFEMGETDGLRAILAGAPWAERVYLTCRAEHLAMTREFYAWDEVESMWRMALQRTRFQPVKGDWVRLTPAHADELVELYALGGGPAYSAAQLEHGVFCGTFVDRRLVAVAGTHLVSPTYGVAAVGNVFTHPGYRGRGYGTAVTSAVVAELLGRGIGDIVLNVNQANQVAIGIYERLGFERYCPFLEGPACALRVPDSG